MKRLLQLTLVLFIATGLTTVANAQNSDDASITASADVIAQMSVLSGNNIDFGNVAQGVTETINYYDGGAGTFEVNASGGASISLDFTQLPTNLSDGSNTLGITYPGATWEDGSSTSSGSTNSFTPGTGVSNLTLPTDGTITVFLGAEVSPTTATVPGNYTGSITLTATYN